MIKKSNIKPKVDKYAIKSLDDDEAKVKTPKKPLSNNTSSKKKPITYQKQTKKKGKSNSGGYDFPIRNHSIDRKPNCSEPESEDMADQMKFKSLNHSLDELVNHFKDDADALISHNSPRQSDSFNDKFTASTASSSRAAKKLNSSYKELSTDESDVTVTVHKKNKSSIKEKEPIQTTKSSKSKPLNYKTPNKKTPLSHQLELDISSPMLGPLDSSLFDPIDATPTQMKKDVAKPSRNSSGRKRKVTDYRESSDSEEMKTPRVKVKDKKTSNEEIDIKSTALLFSIPERLTTFSTNETISDLVPMTNTAAEEDDSGTIKCPVNKFCLQRLKLPFSAMLQEQYDLFLKLNKAGDSEKIPRESMIRARDRFCELHIAEQSIIPEGIKKGYKMKIDFGEDFENRLKKMLPRLLNIINGKVKSHFREKALKSIEEIGSWKAKSVDHMFFTINDTQCGYYGWVGSEHIFKYLMETFKVDNSPLTSDISQPQTINDYIQLVLTPETAVGLIGQDYKLNLDLSEQYSQACDIFYDSSPFGTIVHTQTSILEDIDTNYERF
ncbi:RTC4-like domain-containing protein [Globomyces pollinis-pini]|nr:RTC4-like domain-containing protein [Globomyces pollinis-pini]